MLLGLGVGCGGETNNGVAQTDVEIPDASSTTPNVEGCTCDDSSSCPGTVVGTVTDFSGGGALSGVQIEGNQSSEVVETDSGGGYELQLNVCRSPYVVKASKAGYCDKTNTLDVVGRSTVNNDIQLEERFIGGVVLDMTPNGTTGEPLRNPLGGIRVSLLDTNITDGTSSLGVFVLDRVPVDGELTVLAQDDTNDCYSTAIVESVRTCERGESGVQLGMVCRDEANNGCGLCCTGERVLPDGAQPGDFCQREEPCAVGDEPVWVCNDDLQGATCSCTACPEDNSQGEVCDGRDNDCDGVVDNPSSNVLLDACPSLDGAFVADCAEGKCTYTCENGRVDLNGDISAGAAGNGCECAVSNGGVEICDGQDNDCNGTIDDLSQPPLCAIGEGVCSGATTTCVDGVAQCGREDYARQASEQGVLFEGLDVLEITCDGLDNNCDGRVDENCCAAGEDIFDGNLVASGRREAPTVAVGDQAVLAAWHNKRAPVRNSVWFAIQNALGTDGIPIEQNLSGLDTEASPPVILWNGTNFDLVFIDHDASQMRWSSVDAITQEMIRMEGSLDIGDSNMDSVRPQQLASLEGGFALLWTETSIDDLSACEHSSGSCLWIRSYDSDGNAIGAPFEIAPNSEDHQPSGVLLAPSHSGEGALVVWRDFVQPSVQRWQTLDESFVPIGTQGSLETGGDAVLASTETGYAIVHQVANEQGIPQMHYIFLDNNGGVLSTGLIGEEAEFSQLPKAVAHLGSGRLALVWSEITRDEPALLYTIIDSLGQLEQPSVIISEGVIAEFKMGLQVDPQQLDRSIGFAFIAATLDGVHLGRLNLQGHPMCF